MLPPIRPRPIIPSCIAYTSSSWTRAIAPAALAQGLEVAGGLGADQLGEAERPARGSASSAPYSSTTCRKRPLSGPPLCSWPVEWR